MKTYFSCRCFFSRVAPAGQDSVPPPLPKNAQVPHVPRINTSRGPVHQSTVGQRVRLYDIPDYFAP